MSEDADSEFEVVDVGMFNCTHYATLPTLMGPLTFYIIDMKGGEYEGYDVWVAEGDEKPDDCHAAHVLFERMESPEQAMEKAREWYEAAEFINELPDKVVYF